jgi:hypothetical protein
VLLRLQSRFEGCGFAELQESAQFKAKLSQRLYQRIRAGIARLSSHIYIVTRYKYLRKSRPLTARRESTQPCFRPKRNRTGVLAFCRPRETKDVVIQSAAQRSRRISVCGPAFADLRLRPAFAFAVAFVFAIATPEAQFLEFCKESGIQFLTASRPGHGIRPKVLGCCDVSDRRGS